MSKKKVVGDPMQENLLVDPETGEVFLDEALHKAPLCTFDEDGRECLDVSQVAVPLRFKAQENISAQVARLVETHLSVMAADQGYETFEEADDFDVGDDYDPQSPYELDEEPVYVHRTQVEPPGQNGDAEPSDRGPEKRVQHSGKKNQGRGARTRANKGQTSGNSDAGDPGGEVGGSGEDTEE